MKKNNISKVLILCTLIISTAVGIKAYSYSGRYGGTDGKSINFVWWTGWNIQGDYTEATAANRPDSNSYWKQVYARCGEDGSYSEWAAPATKQIRHKDLGPYTTDKYEAKAFWQ